MNTEPKPRGRPRNPTPPVTPVANALSSRSSLRDDLDHALAGQQTPCAGDDRFIEDRIPPTTQDALRALCNACGARLACRAYAIAEKPTVGYWASRAYGASRHPGKP